MPEAEHGVLRQRLESYADKREQVCDGDGAAFLFRPGPLLDESVHRDDKESSGHAEQGQLRQNNGVADARPEKAAPTLKVLMPPNPGRIMPGSIFLPEASPATKLPIPMPRLRAARR